MCVLITFLINVYGRGGACPRYEYSNDTSKEINDSQITRPHVVVDSNYPLIKGFWGLDGWV